MDIRVARALGVTECNDSHIARYLVYMQHNVPLISGNVDNIVELLKKMIVKDPSTLFPTEMGTPMIVVLKPLTELFFNNFETSKNGTPLQDGTVCHPKVSRDLATQFHCKLLSSKVYRPSRSLSPRQRPSFANKDDVKD